MNTSRNGRQPASAGTLGGKGTLPAQSTGFNTFDNWGHKAPTQSKRKRTRKKRLKGNGPEHVYNTLGYTNKACPRLSFIEKFARIAVLKLSIIHWYPNQLSHLFAIIYRPLHFSLLLTEAFVWQLNLAFKKKINTFTHQQDHLSAK